MKKQIKSKVNSILASIGFAMGVAVIVIPIIDVGVDINNIIRLLGISAVSLGLFALNNIPREKDLDKTP